MSVLSKIAHFQDRRDELPNQELARELAESRNTEGIREIADNLWNTNQNVQSDCLKVLYEIGYLSPGLIAEYADEFLRLLESRNNRLAWGGMIALSTVADLAADTVYPRFADIQKVMERGSVITVDAGIQTLAILASTGGDRRSAILPYLLRHLRACRPKDVPQHAEKILPAVDADHEDAFVAVLEERLPEMTESQTARVSRVIRRVQAARS